MSDDTGDLPLSAQLKLLGAQLEEIGGKIDDLRSSDRGLWAEVRSLKKELTAELAARAMAVDLQLLRERLEELRIDREVRRGQATLVKWAAGLMAPIVVAAISFAVQLLSKQLGGP